MQPLRSIYQGLDARFRLTPFLEKESDKKLVRGRWMGGLLRRAGVPGVHHPGVHGRPAADLLQARSARAWDSVTFIKSNVPMGG